MKSRKKAEDFKMFEDRLTANHISIHEIGMIQASGLNGSSSSMLKVLAVLAGPLLKVLAVLAGPLLKVLAMLAGSLPGTLCNQPVRK